MLRENEKGNPARGISRLTLKVENELEKRRHTMEIVKSIYDLAAVLVFLGVAMAPRALITYLTLHQED
jgi:hypothetical protein